MLICMCPSQKCDEELMESHVNRKEEEGIPQSEVRPRVSCLPDMRAGKGAMLPDS
jgi:hypothetical protein